MLDLLGGGSQLCPVSREPGLPLVWPLLSQPHCGGAAARSSVSCHQVTVAQRVAQCRSQQEDVQLKGQKYPKEIIAGLINIRPVGDNCQTIGQQGARVCMIPANPL